MKRKKTENRILFVLWYLNLKKICLIMQSEFACSVSITIGQFRSVILFDMMVFRCWLTPFICCSMMYSWEIILIRTTKTKKEEERMDLLQIVLQRYSLLLLGSVHFNCYHHQNCPCLCECFCHQLVSLEWCRFELETKLQEMERRKIDDDARRHAEQERQEEKVRQAHLEKEQAEREAISLRWENEQPSSF